MEPSRGTCSKPHLTLSVVDVYDSAAIIGQDFEFLIDTYGIDSVAQLMPKVIKVLEQLECLANSHEGYTEELDDLREQVEKLQADKAARANVKNRYHEELLEIEESWTAQTEELHKSLEKLQEQNRELLAALNENRKPNGGNAESLRSHELKARIAELESLVQQQSSELRQQRREIRQRRLDQDSIAAQLERVCQENADLQRRSSTPRRELEVLLHEKTDLEAMLESRCCQISIIQQHLSESTPPTPSEDISRLTCPLEAETESSESTEQHDATTNAKPTEATGTYTTADEGEEDIPPCFTLHELKAALNERNELRSKLAKVEQELSYYRPRGRASSEDEHPVQGPINREPRDKLYPDEGGVRKFFNRLLDNIIE